MAIPVNIGDLINSRVVESNRIEFKADWNPNPIIHTICAFANDIDNMGGGYIVIGVEEQDGGPVLPVKGVEQARIDGIMKELVGLCHRIEPLYRPVVEPVEFDGKYVIVIWVTGGYGRPYRASKDVFTDKANKQYYIRKFSSTVVASQDEEKELFYVSTDIPFDDRPNLTASVDELDVGLMRAHLKEVGSALYERSAHMSALELAGDMQLLSGPPEAPKPLNVGLLMFTEDPERYFRYARIEVADIPDPTGTGMEEKTFTGPIQRQLRDALAYIRNYVIREKVIKSPDRAEAERVFNYPYAAVEEILANAVYHRSYQIREPITVRITRDRMEIISFPGFDRSISDRSISEYDIRARIYRNRRIGDLLKELKLIEGRNTGFPNAYKALKENGSEYPVFEMDEARSYLSVTLKIHPAFLQKSDRQDAYRRRVLDAMGGDSLFISEIAERMGYKGITAKLSGAVADMVAIGAIEKHVAGSGIKYRVKR